MALCCSHGLVTSDLKIRCEVRRLWRCLAVASVDHRYMMHACVFDINTLFLRTSKFWLRLNCSYFFLRLSVKLFLNCSCSIDSLIVLLICRTCFLCDLFCVLKSLFAVVFADVTGIRIMNTFLGADHSTSEGGGGGVGDFEKKYPASAYA